MEQLILEYILSKRKNKLISRTDFLVLIELINVSREEDWNPKIRITYRAVAANINSTPSTVNKSVDNLEFSGVIHKEVSSPTMGTIIELNFIDEIQKAINAEDKPSYQLGAAIDRNYKIGPRDLQAVIGETTIIYRDNRVTENNTSNPKRGTLSVTSPLPDRLKELASLTERERKLMRDYFAMAGNLMEVPEMKKLKIIDRALFDGKVMESIEEVINKRRQAIQKEGHSDNDEGMLPAMNIVEFENGKRVK